MEFYLIEEENLRGILDTLDTITGTDMVVTGGDFIDSFISNTIPKNDYVNLINGDYVDITDERLTEINIALYKKSAITSLNLPYVEKVGYEFARDSAIANISIPNLKDVGFYAFYDTPITELNFPELLNAGNGAFARCCYVTSVNLPKLTKCGTDLFADLAISVDAIDSISLPELIFDDIEYTYDDDGVTVLYTTDPNRALFSSANVKTVRISNQNTRIPAEMFNYSAVENIYGAENITDIGDAAFIYTACISDLNDTFPKLKRVGNSSFAAVRTITEINHPGIEYIEDGAFTQINTLVSVNLPNCRKFTDIVIDDEFNLSLLPGRYGRFSSCQALTNVNLPVLEEIMPGDFYNCTSLTKLSFPCVRVIAQSAFVECTSLEALILSNATVVRIDPYNIFTDTPIENGAGYVYVPRALLASYQTNADWLAVLQPSSFRAIEDYPEITGYVTE